MARKQDRETVFREQAIAELLVALVRAHQDPFRPTIREQGIEERDLAFEAGLLAPADMELAVYGTQKRRRVLTLLRQMQERGWARMEVMPPRGAYHIVLLPKGAEHADTITRSWWRRLMDRWKAR